MSHDSDSFRALHLIQAFIISTLMDLNTLIAVAAAVAALLSALYASVQARHAAKSASLALQDHRERHESMQAELIDGIGFETSAKECMVAIACNIINRAIAPNTVSAIELHVHEFSDDGKASKLVLRPITTELPRIWALQPFPSPLNLAERSTVSGWVSFRIPDNFASKRTIDKYELVFRNTLGHRAAVELHLLRKIEHGTHCS